MLHEVHSDFTRVYALTQPTNCEFRVRQQGGIALLNCQPLHESRILC